MKRTGMPFLDQRNYLTTAFNLALYYHRNQVDKQGLPYIQHILAVASAVSTPEDMAVALLHDIIEDTSYSVESLMHEFPASIYIPVLILTRDKNKETYEQYIHRIVQCGNQTALRVKRSDLLHNASRRTEAVDPDGVLKVRYTKAIRIIKAAIT